MRTVGFAVCSLVVLALGARGDANLPDLGPQVISVFPLGARQGETLEVQILGRNLDGTRDITFARLALPQPSLGEMDAGGLLGLRGLLRADGGERHLRKR